MKKFHRLLVLLLALCMVSSFASAAGIAEVSETQTSDSADTQDVTVYEPADTVLSASGSTEKTEIPDRMTWTLDEYGTLWIGGKGIMKPITSADQQPWAKVRTQIETVRFCEDAHLAIDSIA